MTTDPGDVARYRENIRDETDGAFLYRVLAELEDQPQLAELYERLALTEERHASFWEEKIRGAGQRVPPRRPTRRARILAWSARRLGPGVLSKTLARQEQAGQFVYDDQPEAHDTSLPADERSHARLLRTLTDGTGGVEGGALARLEGRHRTVGGNALRAAVLGANDGLVSNLALVTGVAGADISNQAVLIAGLAGLLAGASSMALGEWLSVQSSRELYQRQIDIEAMEIAEIPEEEEEELALIYRAKGLPEDQARQLAARVMSDPETALDTLAREELGIDPDELGGSPWEAATTSFFLFGFGAVIPVLPFLFTSGAAAVIISLASASLALFATGAGITLVTGRGAWRSGLRQALLGLAAAGLTYAIGSLLGVAITG
ncbi:MAG: VIT1/CCC1 transporter family protein [Actinomycetota bacterium]